ncbi:MAG: hypothetical protein IJX92_02055 [Clostridia bacterium]|nr:hypothetical protein [Clostridia bacterium]
MRNKIIALILTVVMATMVLAGCSSAFNYAEEDLDSYVTFDVAAFKDALTKIEIEDADFTTKEDVRVQKVVDSIVKSLADYATKNKNKSEEGEFSLTDVLYYAYYTTYTVVSGEGENQTSTTYVFDSGEMKVSDFDDSTTTVKNKHSISLGAIDVNDEDADALAVALKTAIAALENKAISPYKTITSGSIKTADKKAFLDNIKSIYVSYSREYTVNEVTTKETATYEKLDLSDTTNPIVAKLLEEGTTATIDKTIEIGEDKKSEFNATIDGVDYKYSSVKVLFAVEEEGDELVTFEYTPYTAKKELAPNGLCANTFKVEIPKDAKLTYHVYPVYFYDVSDVNATSVIREILGSKVTTESLEVLASEEYKNGDKTVKALVEELVKLYTDKKDDIVSDVKVAELLEKYEEAKAKADAEGATEADKTKADDAKAAYDDAVAANKEVDDKIAEIVAAKKGEESVEDKILEEYKDDVYEDLKSDYDTAIVDAVGAAIWELIEKSVKINSYPEALVKEAKDHLYNEYEYKFYNENTSTSTNAESNYKAYNGDLDAYMVAVTKASDIDGVDAKIEEEAKEFVDPIIRIYVVSKALADDANAVMFDQLKAKEFIYDADYEYDDSISEEANEKAKAEAEESAQKYKDYEFWCAEHFLFDDEAFDKYKEYYGQSNYESIESQYGETNIRTALQVDRLFDYLLSAKVEEHSHDGHSHESYVYEDGGKLQFYNITYTLKADKTEGDATK